MDLKQLQYFITVAELESFTRASEALGVAQPALSRQIRLLEVELRQNLLIRNGRGAIPTDAGKLLLGHARGIHHQLERAREELLHMRGGLTGRVALGLPPSLARALTVPLTRAFRAEMPDAQLTIREGLSTAMQEELLNARLDIALLYNATNTPGLHTERLQGEELVYVSARPPGLLEEPQDLFVDMGEIATQPLVIPSRPNAIRMHVEAAFLGLGLTPNITLEIDGVPAILDLVADGAGNAILTRHAVSSSIRTSSYKTRMIKNPHMSIEVALATSSKRPSTHIQHKTIDLLKRIANEKMN
jgi:LysR family nitrogen assimilation transcriptional regulator